MSVSVCECMGVYGSVVSVWECLWLSGSVVSVCGCCECLGVL